MWFLFFNIQLATAVCYPHSSRDACNNSYILNSLALISDSPLPHLTFCFIAQLYVVREGDPLEQRFFSAFIEDKNRNQAVSYYEFLQTLQREISKAVSNAPK